ncbi:type II toxin-antitoxin system RelE/ParE family toxin [Tolypothrix sp. FACHB-123]|uniref:type II toxin-antitoxin system RelE/ParE family toxin n=1 Tax=Tolypothrix sp. FACHB-123 TaxID=2692868 RepID=UPI001682ADED|nr:type II toxin-antitoxin system RelE/ParE family toxin [Tolypothrix sp. FACHB-123]MBD2359020.1 type II toxin-antitoxin system RelE/ParE family toxin [Tolypothrix sp. FACHB-123]
MKRHIISPEANQDLEAIIDYFTTRNIDAGERFVDEFNKKCRYLANFPNMGRSYADIKDYLRGVPLDGYIILYRVTDSGIEILRVVSGYRDLESLFEDSGDD